MQRTPTARRRVARTAWLDAWADAILARLLALTITKRPIYDNRDLIHPMDGFVGLRGRFNGTR
jgi:hypothetical protein